MQLWCGNQITVILYLTLHETHTHRSELSLSKTSQGFILTMSGCRTNRHLYKSLLRLTSMIQHIKGLLQKNHVYVKKY